MPSTSGDSLCPGWGGGALVPQTHVCIKFNCFYNSKEKTMFSIQDFEAFYSTCRFCYTWNGGEIEKSLHSSLSNAPSYLISLKISQSILL